MKLLALSERQEVDQTVEEEPPEHAKQTSQDPQPKAAIRAAGHVGVDVEHCH